METSKTLTSLLVLLIVWMIKEMSCAENNSDICGCNNGKIDEPWQKPDDATTNHTKLTETKPSLNRGKRSIVNWKLLTPFALEYIIGYILGNKEMEKEQLNSIIGQHTKMIAMLTRTQRMLQRELNEYRLASVYPGYYYGFYVGIENVPW